MGRSDLEPTPPQSETKQGHSIGGRGDRSSHTLCLVLATATCAAVFGAVSGCGDNLQEGAAATPVTERLFWDDFQGEEPTKWTPFAGIWELGNMPDAARVYQAPRKILNQTIAGSWRWTDYQVQARVTLTEDTGRVGLLGRVEGDHHYYEFLLGPDGDGVPSWFIRRRVDHVWTTLASGTFPYKIGVPYVLRFTLKGDVLEGAVAAIGPSGELPRFVRLGTTTDATFTFGRIGLASYFNSSLFDDVAVDGFGDITAVTQALVSGPWGPIAELRDNTTTFTASKPAGGWYVVPIHATLRASDGKVLFSGFGQQAEANCTSTTQKTVGETFVITPSDIGAITDGDVLLVQPISQQNLDPARDVLYCSGQTTMADGRIFMAAGSQYPNILPNSNPELGLNYARVYNPTSNSISRVSFPAKGGQSSTPGMKWYPTSTLLPNGTLLTYAGFHWSIGGTGSQKNRSLELFDPKLWDANPAADPYTVLTQHTEGTSETDPQLGYTNMYVLPKPIPAATAGGGFARSMTVMGSLGKVFLYNTEPGPTGTQRLIARTNALSVSPASSQKAGGAASVMLPDGKLMLANGSTHGVGSSRAYFYDPYADNWTTLDLGISRTYGNAVWLPDGTVLIANGYVNEPGGTNVTSPVGAPDGVRKVQIVDPFARTVSTQPAWPEPTGRGYHNVAVLLKDGRVMIGGGKDANHNTGCEKNELRLYAPPYLSAGPRPSITNVPSGQTLSVGGAPLTINFTETVRTVRGVVLMAPTAMTHGFDSSQRYLPLTVTSPPAGGSVTVALPATINEAPPGDYLLYVVSELGVPSVGVHVRLTPPTDCTFVVNGSVDSYIEAESASRWAAPFQTVADGARSAGAYLQSNPAGADNATVPDEGQVAWYDVDVSSGGTFFVWLLGNGPDSGSDTVYVSANGNADQTITLPAATWGWVRGATSIALPAGKHTLKIKSRESGAQIDQIRLTKSTSTTPPSGAGAPALGCVVRALTNLVARDTALGGDGIANNTQWTIQPSFAGGGGQLAFGDRTYTIGAVPAAAAHLNGKPWIRPAVDSKTYVPPAGTPPTQASVTVYGSFVYLALDSRHNTTRLSDAGYAIQGYTLTVNEGATVRTYNVWRKAVAFGATVNLPTLTTTTPPPYLTIIE